MDTPRPRIVTWRWLVVALAVGALLAVASVPVGAVAANLSMGRGSATTIVEDLIIGDHQVVTTLDRVAMGMRWNRTSTPLNPQGRMIVSFRQSPQSARMFERVPESIWIDRDGHARSATLWLVGWPMHSAYGVRRTGPPASGVQRVGLLEPAFLGGSRSLPWLPHVPGLLANIAFYALLVLTPIVLVRWWCVRRRLKQGRCIACGYELGAGVGVCPECGLAGKRAMGIGQ